MRTFHDFRSHVESFQSFVFTNSASLNTSVCSSFCTCISIYIPGSGIAGSKAMYIYGFDCLGIISSLNKSFSWTCCLLEVHVREEMGPHSRQIRVFLTGITFAFGRFFRLDFPESVNRGSCWVLHKNTPFSFPSPCQLLLS